MVHSVCVCVSSVDAKRKKKWNKKKENKKRKYTQIFGVIYRVNLELDVSTYPQQPHSATNNAEKEHKIGPELKFIPQTDVRCGRRMSRGVKVSVYRCL